MTAPMVLSGGQRRVLTLTQRYGARVVIAAITVVSVVVSVTITSLALLVSPADRSMVIWSLAVATVVPLLVAPACSTAVVRLSTALAEAVDELHVHATTDPLTGLANRRHFFAVAQQRLARPDRVFLVAMVDLDHFKAVNDAHGHRAGDEALVTIASTLRSVVGVTGVAARLGGDEFVILCDVDDESLVGLTTAIEACARAIVTPSGLRLSASVGLRVVESGTAPDEALRLADVALYAAKARRAEGASR